MRAVGVPRFGGPEVLEVVELPEPVPGEGEVRIRVAAATVNPTDIGLRDGHRAEALKDLPPPWVPGMELAGEIDAVGPGSEWSPGQRVIAIVLPFRPLGGAQAELVVVPGASVAEVPDGASIEQAATLPMNGLTVRRALDLLALDAGQTLAVTGSAGAVGGYAIELAKLEGLRVVADAAPADEALVRGFGADLVVPRGAGCAQAIRAAIPGGVDAVLDAALLGPAILGAVRDGGQLAAVRPFPGESERGIEIRAVAVSEYATNQQALRALVRRAGAGQLTLRVAETFAPERAGDAHRRLEAGGVRGRLLITF
ncbi:MAG TPA: NADP-dependent oxidoreductase [Solirubrobacteraceae bacterium]|nr:NADP-dependent oxidoreductase [Solirubrobacteraceae bacterium]